MFKISLAQLQVKNITIIDFKNRPLNLGEWLTVRFRS